MVAFLEFLHATPAPHLATLRQVETDVVTLDSNESVEVHI